MSRFPNNIPPPVGGRPETVGELIENASEVNIKLGQPYRVVFTSTTQDGAGARTVTGRVLNASGQAVRGGFPVEVYISTTRGGSPGGSQTVAWVTGDVEYTIAVNVHWMVLTAADGTFSFTMTTTVGSLRSVAGVTNGAADYSELV